MPKFFLLALTVLSAFHAFAIDSYTVTWRELRQDKFVGRIRNTGWGAGPTVYDYNTPFFVEVTLCPVWLEQGRSRQVSARDIHVGKSSRYGSEFWETDCRVLGTSKNHTTWDGQVRKLDEAISFSERDLKAQIQSIKEPSWLRRLPDFGARPVSGEVAYVLRVMVMSDYSILPLIPRAIGRVGMRTALNVLADHYVELPAQDLGIEGLDLPRTYAQLRALGMEIRPFAPGALIETQEKTYGYKIELGR